MNLPESSPGPDQNVEPLVPPTVTVDSGPEAMPDVPASTPVRLVLHGGAGEPAHHESHAAQRAALARVAASGQAMLLAGAAALEVVQHCVRLLEDCPLFNAGTGAVLNADGHAELDAAIADGQGRRFGAVAGVTRLKNPIDTARLVMEQSPHVLIVGAGAEALAATQGVSFVDNETLVTGQRRHQLAQARAAGSIALDHDTPEVVAQGVGTGSGLKPEAAADTAAFGTVGAVARDLHGHLAAATSTGGLTNKRPGRVGDSAVPGAGTFADDDSLAVSCTGTGEAFLRAAFGAEVHARVAWLGESTATACRKSLDDMATRFGGRGGCIAVGADGSLAMPFTTGAMYRAWVDTRGAVRVAVGPDDARVETSETLAPAEGPTS